MHSSDTPGRETGNAAPRDVERYVCEVEALLLDIPWRRRRELIGGLREHLRANPEQVDAEPPHDYAAELRESTPATTAGLLSGLRSMSWPTPIEWCESVVRGVALLLVAWVAYDFLAAVTQPIFGDPSPTPWTAMLHTAVQAIYPTPALRGSQRDGIVVFPLLAVLIGQLTTAAVLRRAPHRRPLLRILTVVSIGVIIGLFGFAAR